MENDLDIFRQREERKKKKKKVYPEPKAIFIANGKKNEAEVFLTEGEIAEGISTPPIECISTPKEKSMLMNWQKPYTED